MKNKTKKSDTSWKVKMERINRSNLWAGDMSRIAVRVLDYLEENNRSQKWLADKLEVTPQQVTKIVKGRQNMSWGAIKKLEQALSIELVRVAGKTTIAELKVCKREETIIWKRLSTISYSEGLLTDFFETEKSIFGDIATINDSHFTYNFEPVTKYKKCD